MYSNKPVNRTSQQSLVNMPPAVYIFWNIVLVVSIKKKGCKHNHILRKQSFCLESARLIPKKQRTPFVKDLKETSAGVFDARWQTRPACCAHAFSTAVSSESSPWEAKQWSLKRLCGLPDARLPFSRRFLEARFSAGTIRRCKRLPPTRHTVHSYLAHTEARGEAPPVCGEQQLISRRYLCPCQWIHI